MYLQRCCNKLCIVLTESQLVPYGYGCIYFVFCDIGPVMVPEFRIGPLLTLTGRKRRPPRARPNKFILSIVLLAIWNI